MILQPNKLTKKQIIELIQHYLKVEKEVNLATYRCSVSPRLIKHRDALRSQLESMIENYE